jgi:DNA polymerase elongation subunit (family B)
MVQFQITGWYSDDIDLEDSDSDEEEEDYGRTKYKDKEFKIVLFGKDMEENTYTLLVNGFTPYFYVKVPNTFTKKDCYLFEQAIRNKMWNRYQDGFLRITIHRKMTFRNFNNNKKDTFVRLIFNSKSAMRSALNIFQKKTYKCENIKCKGSSKGGVCNNNGGYSSIRCKGRYIYTIKPSKLLDCKGLKPYTYMLYENMIDPMIRFIHHRKIKPSGWIELPDDKLSPQTLLSSRSQYDIQVDWKYVKAITKDVNAPLKVLAYDIECDSSHGDFPLPIKDYGKLSKELVAIYEKIFKIKQKKELTTFEKKEIKKITSKQLPIFLEELISSAFQGGHETYEMSKVYTKIKNNIPEKDEIQGACNQIAKYLHTYIDRQVSEKKLIRTKKKSYCIDKITQLISDTEDEDMLEDIVDTDNTDSNIQILRRDMFHQDNSTQLSTEKKLHTQSTRKKYNFPLLKGDQTIQIGCSFVKYGETTPYKNIILTLGTCDPIKDTIVKTYTTEKQLLLDFVKLINREDPDIITGYNIVGFDTPWLWKRAKELGIESVFYDCSKIKYGRCELKKKQQKSSVGQLVTIEYVDIPGRSQMDLYLLVQKGYKLSSYKLDNVSAEFIKGSITSITEENDRVYIQTDNCKGLHIGNYINFVEKNGYLENKYMDGKKFEIIDIQDTTLIIREKPNLQLDAYKCYWCLGKDDVTPKDIFEKQKGTSYDRCVVAKYCMMDVILCVELLNKLEFITLTTGMSNVCLIPFDWALNRGQGVKIVSLVSDILRTEHYLLPFLYKTKRTSDSYEGAIVLPPKPGIYLDDPVAVLDYASLYPSSMIEKNISHETICAPDSVWIGESGATLLRKYGHAFEDITYDTFECVFTPSGLLKEKIKTGVQTVRYVQPKDGNIGMMPKILSHLLKTRKDTRKKIKYKIIINSKGNEYVGLKKDNKDGTITITDENNENHIINCDDIVSEADRYTQFQKNTLDGAQLAYKITANSLYGQLGSRVSSLYYKELAASTTAVGRKQLEIAQEYVEDKYHYPMILDDGRKIYLENDVVYGDTDSIFVKYDCRYPDGSRMKGKDALKESIRLSIITEEKIQTKLHHPQYLEYEKTFYPFILFGKKKYVGNKYEKDPNTYKQTAMGIVLKRRDNAPIVKVVFGDIIDSIMTTQTIEPSLELLQQHVHKLIDGDYGLDMLTITKTLSSYYKEPDRVAHKVLAERIGERDPGNKPQVNDRVPYIYIVTKGKVALQGDRIEHPDYIREHKLKPDYVFYITNQIMKPVCQIYALSLDKLPGYTQDESMYDLMYQNYIKKGKLPHKAIKLVLEKKQKVAEQLVFGETLREANNKRVGNQEITKWFSSSKTHYSAKKNINESGTQLYLDSGYNNDFDDDDDDDY